MKSRELHTTPVLIVSNYKVAALPEGKYLHTFTPENTSTIYQFIANKEPILEVGGRYNIGYRSDSGINWVDISAIARADDVDPIVSHYWARKLGEELRAVETKKSNERVVHSAIDGFYLGKKYAWRIYGMAVTNDVFYSFLEFINHPKVPCFTEGSASTAYKDEGIGVAVDEFFRSCVKVGTTGNRFKSQLLPHQRWFRVKGLNALTDKK